MPEGENINTLAAPAAASSNTEASEKSGTLASSLSSASSGSAAAHTPPVVQDSLSAKIDQMIKMGTASAELLAASQIKMAAMEKEREKEALELRLESLAKSLKD